MANGSSSFRRNIIILICFTFLRPCWTGNSPSDLDLSSTTLDPSSNGFMITGNAAVSFFGYSVSTAGDIDNDGYDDIIVGAYIKDIVFVIYGGKESSFLNLDLSTTSLNPLTTGFTITGNANNYFGYSVSTAGDIDNDGYDDIIVGAPDKNGLRGAVYVIYGGEKSAMSNIDLSSTTLNPLTTGFMVTGNAVEDQLGYSVSTAGDINKDGFDDMIIGAPGMISVFVIYGGTKSAMSNWDFSSGETLNPLTTGFMITGNSSLDCFGCSLSTAGDVNNDGYDDIIIGAYGKNSLQGAAYVVYGGPKASMADIVLSSTPLNPLTTGFMITGNAAGDAFGRSLSTARDINNDGYDDIIIGASGKNSDQGAAYVIYGGAKSTMSNWDFSSSAAVLNPLPTGFMITGNAADDKFGSSVSTAGDINNDGYPDIIIGAAAKNSFQGAAYVIYGGEKSAMSNIDLSSTTLNPLTTGFMVTGNAAEDLFGWPVSTAGDINNDGCDDIIVGAYMKNNDQGAAYVIYGGQTHSCPNNCIQCPSASVCTKCKSPYALYQSECLDSCPDGMFLSTTTCEDCPSHCSACTSQGSCQVCSQGFTLSNSLCVPSSYSSQQAQGKATQAISSAARVISSVICVGSTVAPLSALVSKTVQNTRYLNLSVTGDLSEIYKTWNTDLISWDIPNAFSNEDHFKTVPSLFAQYEAGSPFLVNFWPTLLNIVIGFGTFVACILLKKLFEQKKYKGWVHSLVQKVIAGSFNFALIQAYACLDDILFDLVLDAKTNPFNSFFSWASMICAVIFLAVGCLLVSFNFWTVKKYQSIKSQGRKDLIDDFNERNKSWELFYSDFSDDDLWSQSFFAILIIRSTLSSFIITVLYDYPLMQTSYLVVIDGTILFFLYFKMPFNTLRGKLAQYYYEVITFLVHICTFSLSLHDSFGKPLDSVKLVFSTGIIYLNTALIGGSLGFIFVEIYETLRFKTEARNLRQRQDVPEDNQEIQNPTQTAGPLQSSERDDRKINQDQMASIENLYLLSGVNQNGNMKTYDLNDRETNFNADNSRELEMEQSHRIPQQRDQSATQVFIRRKLRILKPKRQGNSSIFQDQTRNNEQ